VVRSASHAVGSRAGPVARWCAGVHLCHDVGTSAGVSQLHQECLARLRGFQKRCDVYGPGAFEESCRREIRTVGYSGGCGKMTRLCCYASLDGQYPRLLPHVLHELRLRLGQRPVPLPGGGLHRRVSEGPSPIVLQSFRDRCGKGWW